MEKRSDLVIRGDERAANRALLRSLGLTDSDFDRPFIGVAATWTEMNPGHVHLRSLADGQPKQGSEWPGGFPSK